MDLSDCEEMLKVLDSCLSRIKWRLKPSTKRRLETDILVLCTRLRPVVLVDYGGIMPKLQEDLSSLLFLAQKKSSTLQHLRVMILDDMVYIIHIEELAEHVCSSCSSKHLLVLLDLEQNPPKILQPTENNEVALELFSVQKLFSTIFSIGGERGCSSAKPEIESSEPNVDLARLSEYSILQPAKPIDLSSYLQDARITLPSLNGWLLGYPVTYLFRKEIAEKACYNLSTKSLCIFKIFITRRQTSGSQLYENELMSFSMPCDMNQRMDKEPWIQVFLSRLSGKLERCKQIWVSMRLEMEVKESHQQSVVL
ncbi:hypothetical protein Cni_G05192 [Canna indica]|uniref:Uncharacterized protein n=1 Tax=Canna indica TaxID=4628 RepID=A0AAQ3JYM2_9LILI|nr:hypothetical protein Cni_G05192 [Canna indica]